jgi:hypothetical protein
MLAATAERLSSAGSGGKSIRDTLHVSGLSVQQYVPPSPLVPRASEASAKRAGAAPRPSREKELELPRATPTSNANICKQQRVTPTTNANNPNTDKQPNPLALASLACARFARVRSLRSRPLAPQVLLA